MKRTAIIIEKDLTTGKSANVAAILMGQIAIIDPDLYHQVCINDRQNKKHASIKYSVIILKASKSQIISLSEKIINEFPKVKSVLFSEIGQSLHNEFQKYQAIIANSSTEATNPSGIVLTGNEDEIKILTKKFSLLND